MRSSTPRQILVTGGAGHIGSPIVVQRLEANHSVVVYDNLSNSSEKVFERIECITGRRATFIRGDVRDGDALRRVFAEYSVGTVIHLAGLKSVREAESEPLRYYDNNVHGTLCLLEEMRRARIDRMVFSSSATVYGNQGLERYSEDAAVAPTNVYGRTKAMAEAVLRDCANADMHLRVAILRYFNPVG